MASGDTNQIEKELEELKQKQKATSERLEQLAPRSSRLQGRLQPAKRNRDDDDRERATNPRARADVSNGDSAGKRRLLSSAIATSVRPSVSSVAVAKTATTGEEKERVKPVMDEGTKKRNRNMFGMLMGQLAKFKEETTAIEEKVSVRRELEEKAEQRVREEGQKLRETRREEVVKSREEQRELNRTIRLKEGELRIRKEGEALEKQAVSLSKFIRSQASPALHYLPAKHNDTTQRLLEEQQATLEAKLTAIRESTTKRLAQLVVDLEEADRRFAERRSGGARKRDGETALGGGEEAESDEDNDAETPKKKSLKSQLKENEAEALAAEDVDFDKEENSGAIDHIVGTTEEPRSEEQDATTA